MKNNLVIATRNTSFGKELKQHIERNSEFKILDISISEEDMLVFLETNKDSLYGLILTSDIATKLGDKRLEVLVDALYTVRKLYPNLVITILANETPGHPLLAELVQMGIYNIFIKGVSNFSVQELIDSMRTPMTFASASYLLEVDTSIPWRKEIHTPNELKLVINNKQPDQNEDVQKTNAQIQKNVIKRQLQIQFQQKTIETVGIPIPKKLIIIGSAYERAGSTFFAHLLARALAKEGVGVAYIENPFRTPYTFDRFIGHLKEDSYRSLFFKYFQPETSVPLQFEWEHEGVHLICLNPQYEKPYSEDVISAEHFLKILFALQDIPYIIIDIGNDWNKEVVKELKEIANNIFVVIDTDIPKVQWFIENSSALGYNTIHEISKDEKSYFVVNRGVERAYSILKEFNDYSIPEIPREIVFQSQIEGTFDFKGREWKKKQEMIMEPFLQLLIPKSLRKKKRNSLFSFGKPTFRIQDINEYSD